MADISDVEQAVTNAITSILYPAGFTQSSIIGAPCRIYRGWPNSATLNADLSAGTVNITVATDNDSGRTTTRYLSEWRTKMGVPGVTAIATDQMILISGCPAAGDVVGALIDGIAYAYRIQPGDTTGLVASNLSCLIQANRPVSTQASTLALQGAGSIQVRVVCDGATSFESRRQEKDLRIMCWCTTPPVRDSVATAIDSAISHTSFLVLPDSTDARISYRNTASYDQAQNALLYRRDLIYVVEYPTITALKQPSMLFGASEINGNIIYG